ncbi:bifunctional 4-hydroxy-2-oxoglutarate aldolase/2-dehydro-3-deoxy-phosphogluconate aldolase [Thermosediminibacter oceani]|uniref:2-keto-3-deoxy-phosphogluconate aldolase n=1 Tax=Thermosediminibacter oceani (strain ATCC BAA-1034 / DSM 16646 / JW/IW-1228P) TaxID=555079 RepID=D9RZ72_THEOJ|nr:bifunctional 4-hydroxy-2-oxoglutarate aldolase/2-dehydro-3-deoxy-phosphogluconate aldolase [Thermosediminibacter oceani]ADL08626.1 2-keto-3-deoxy-phosphogluconate aldolase [Thermosediminibacter oceani DSM 16646]
MKKHEIIEKLKKLKITAVIRNSDINTIFSLADALKKGGIEALEITVEAPGALDVIKELSKGNKYFVGAGTVLDAETARAAILAGAKFIFTPVMKLDVIKLCNRYGIPVIPGATTPTEILTGYEAGADFIKVFPAGVFGPQYIKEILGPLKHIPIFVTGGINKNNIKDFILAGATGVSLGGALVDRDLIAKGMFDKITERAIEFVNLVNQV